MKDIAEIDKNFVVETDVCREDTVLFDVTEKPLCTFGLMHDTVFRRIPEEIAKQVSEGVYLLHTNTAGGRLKFRTDSPYIYLRCELPEIHQSQNIPRSGVAGFDIYIGGEYRKTFIPPLACTTGYDGIFDLETAEMRDYIIHFPLYNNVNNVCIGIQRGAKLESTAYGRGGKIVFYGSSITQGGCVSRPGLAYTNIISDYLDIDTLNLGFSGNARGEQVMADYVASLESRIFVFDYDHNAPSPEHLAKTHEPFFKTFRARHPQTPVVFLSAPDIGMKLNREPWEARRSIIRKTYENALAAGDKNVYFLDGETLWGEDFRFCTVDATHPNDIGHYRMAKKLIPLLEKILQG